MKKLATVFGIMCVSLGITAQDNTPELHRVEFGIRFMPTVTAFKMRTSDGGTVQGEATLGLGIGGMLAFNFTNHVGIQTEVIYNSYSQKFRDRNLDRTIDIKYVNIPLLLSLNTGKSKPVNLNLVFGPQMGFNVGSKITTSGGGGTDTLQAVAAFKSGDLGFAYGAGLEFALNTARTIRLDLGFRGVWGFVDISQQPTTTPAVKTYNVVEHDNLKVYSGYLGISFLF